MGKSTLGQIAQRLLQFEERACEGHEMDSQMGPMDEGRWLAGQAQGAKRLLEEAGWTPAEFYTELHRRVSAKWIHEHYPLGLVDELIDFDMPKEMTE